MFFFFVVMPRAPRSTLFPYTTLFRSRKELRDDRREDPRDDPHHQQDEEQQAGAALFPASARAASAAPSPSPAPATPAPAPKVSAPAQHTAHAVVHQGDGPHQRPEQRHQPHVQVLD